MKYWQIVYPDGGTGENRFDVLSEKEILDYYFPKWWRMYAESGRELPSNAEQACINDWILSHGAIEYENSE